MSTILNDLVAQVQASVDVEKSAIILINGLVAKLNEAGSDPTKISDLQTSLKSSASSLAAAVVANTPAA